MTENREAKVVITADNKQYNKSVEESAKATEKLNTALTKTSENLSKINKATAKGLMKIGATELAGLTALSAIAATLEKQTSNIQSNLALNKASSQYNAVTSSIRELSRTIPVARGEIAQMATEVSNLGFVSGAQISKVTTQFSKMGIATGESPTALAQNMVQFQRAMGVVPSAQTMSPYNQSTTLLSARAGVAANDILSFAGNVAPAARVAGLNQSTVLGLSTAATRAGADGTYASSTISQILNDITMLRYSKSPEMKRYSSALNIPIEQLTGPVGNTDTFNRDIISKILEASQSAEGPTKLGMLGFDGLRAKKALQMMASEQGGVEQWIKTAQYGMGTQSIETGFQAASDGLADQMVMLKGQITDLGQVVGEPTMKAFTDVATITNKAAEVMQRFVEPLAKVTGIFAGPLATAMVGMGAMLAAWKTFSTYALLKRGTYNTMTSALGSGFVSGQQVARGMDPDIPVNRMAANVMSGDPMRASALQRTMFGIGSGIGTMVPGLTPALAKGPYQKALEGMQRFTHFMSQGTTDWYRRAGMTDPADRYADKMQQRLKEDDYNQKVADRNRRIGLLQQANPDWSREKILADPDKGVRKFIGDEPERPAHMFAPKAKYKFWETVGGAAWAPFRAATDATRMAGEEGLHGMAAARKLGGGALGGIAGGLASLLTPQTAALMAGFAAFKTWESGSQYNKRWSEGGEGIGGQIASTLTKYNEKLGIATQSLQRFTVAVDEANPARSEDIQMELSDETRTFYRGKSANYEMIDERMKVFAKNPDSAKKYIASMGQLNADQLVQIFTDLGHVLNKNDWQEVRDWYLTAAPKGKPTAAALNESMRPQAESLVQGVNSNLSAWQKGAAWLTNLTPHAFEEGLGGWEMLGMKNEKTSQSTYDYVAGQAQIGQYLGNIKDPSQVVKGSGSDTEKAAVLAEAIKFAKVTEALVQLNEEYRAGHTEQQRNVLMAAKDNAGGLLGVDLKGINPGDNFAANITQRMYEQVYDQAVNGDPTSLSLIKSGLITPEGLVGGKTQEEFTAGLKDKKTTTAIGTMLNSSGRWSSMSQETRDKWFGEGALKDMGTGINEPTKQLAASFKLLEMATKEFGGTIIQTSGNLAALKAGLSPTDQNYGLISKAQQLNSVLREEPMWTGGTPTTRAGMIQGRADEIMDSLGSMTPPADAADKADAFMTEQAGRIQEAWQKSQDLRKSWERSEKDFTTQMERSQEDFDKSRENADENFYRNQRKSKEAYQRQFIHSEAAFYRSLKYQSQDFYRSREREAEQHARSMKYAAEDTAKAIGDPYNRMDLQMLSDPQAIKTNMGIRLDMVTKQNANIDALKNRGMSPEAINQLGLAEFSNAQQTQHLANTATDADIAAFNDLVKNLSSQSGKLNEEGTGQIRAEQERQIALTQSLQDFTRSLKRTKIEHAIQVKFSQKEFKIGLASATEEHNIAMDQSQEVFDRNMDRTRADHKKSIDRMNEDLKDYNKQFATTLEDMVAQTSENMTAMGVKGANTVATEAKAALKALRAVEAQVGLTTGKWKELGEAEREKNKELNRDAGDLPRRFKKDEWEWNRKEGKASRYENTVTGDVITPYQYRLAMKTGKIQLAEGGIVGPKSGGVKATIAEGGSAEMVLPLNNRGIDFMSQFTKGVAREMVRSMPRTPVSGANINNYDHSTRLSIENVEVASNDPKKFIRELQLEASKKRAALYKSQMSGIGR